MTAPPASMPPPPPPPTTATATARADRPAPAGTFAQLSAIARFTVLEAWRSRLPLLLLLTLGFALAAGAFAAELAITDSARFRLAIGASTLRLSWVFIIAVYVIGSLTRELNERGFEAALSLEITRTTWMLGKLAGYLLCALIAVTCAALVLVWLAPAAAVAAWSASLLFELAIVAAAAVFFTVSLSSLPAAALLCAGFYLLARAIDALQLIAGGSTLIGAGLWRDFAQWAIGALGWLLPALGRFAPSGWLLDAPPAVSVLALQAGQALVFVALLACAALADFHRRDL
jgi:hypothetical protein